MVIQTQIWKKKIRNKIRKKKVTKSYMKTKKALAGLFGLFGSFAAFFAVFFPAPPAFVFSLWIS